MNEALVDSIVRATLYEGYMLYPYRATSVKNRVRWTFGGVFPREFSELSRGMEPWCAQVETLLAGDEDARVQARVRFLQPVIRVVGDRRHEEAVERAVDLGEHSLHDLLSGARDEALQCPPLDSGVVSDEDGAVECEDLRAHVAISAQRAGARLARVRVEVRNETPLDPARTTRELAAHRAMVSTHVILGASGARWLSLADPPEVAAAAARACRNVGLWPVLVGDDESDDTVLASPIILEDHPRVAPESPGDLYDATEIDEILSLRILTLSDAEKEEVRAGDARSRAVLERTEALAPELFARLHGAFRELPARPAHDR